MNTYSKLIFHIIFATKNRKKTLDNAKKALLFKYIWGILNQHHCHLYRINGMEDHIHILVGIKPDLRICDLVKTIKIASSKWIKSQQIFPQFEGWQTGYAVFSCGYSQLEVLIEYIKNQEEHHIKTNSMDELKILLKNNSVEYDSKYI